jgi:ankyrin repeat protein
LQASREGHADVVRALVHAGADVNVRTLSGKTALSLAAMRGHAAVCRVLFEEAGGLETGGVDVTGASLWHDAAASGCVEMIQILREK